jgi:hypothetical protein
MDQINRLSARLNAFKKPDQGNLQPRYLSNIAMPRNIINKAMFNLRPRLYQQLP